MEAADATLVVTKGVSDEPNGAGRTLAISIQSRAIDQRPSVFESFVGV